MLASITASFLAGLAGSPHCVGMCGGLVGACTRHASGGGQLPWHVGRLSTYALLGALAGTFGAVIPGPAWVPAAISVVFLGWFALALAGAVPEPRLRLPGLVKLGASSARNPGVWGRFLFGVSSGFLPCGLVYAALAIPVASGSPLVGAVSMVTFGAGTVPALVFFSAGLRRLTMRDLRIRRVVAAGVFLLALGSMALRQGLLPRGDHAHGPAAHAAMQDMQQAEGQ